MKFRFLHSRGNGGGLKWRRKAKGGKPRQSAHLVTENPAVASGEKDIFHDRRKGIRGKMESEATTAFEFAQTSGQGFLEAFFSASDPCCPKSNSSWEVGGRGGPLCRAPGTWQASPSPEGRGVLIRLDFNTGGLGVPGCLLRTCLCNFSRGDEESQCLWPYLEKPEPFSSSSPACLGISLLFHCKLYPTATAPHREIWFP